MDKTALVIISRQALIRHVLACLLSSLANCEEVVECGSPQEIPLRTEDANRRVFIIDAELPDSQIVEVINLAYNNRHKVVILGSSYNKKRLVDLIALKADGYFTTDMSENELMVLLKKVELGGPVIAESLVSELVDKLTGAQKEDIEEKSYNMLTPREKELLKLLTKGYTNDQIAKNLMISIFTVKNHVHNILEKLEISNRAQLISYVLTRRMA